MRNTLKYSWLFFTCLLTCSLSAESYTFRGVTMAEGLSDLLVNVIYKDAEGFIWLGTDNCLDRFDGVKIKHYPFSSADVKRKRVNAIVETNNKQLWVGNGLGLWRLNKETEMMVHISPETIDCSVLSLFFDGKQTLYVGTEKGLFIYHSGQLTRVMLDKNIFSPSNRIYGICSDGMGMLWLATEQGLFSYSSATGKTVGYHFAAEGGHSCMFRNLARIKNTLYLGTSVLGIVNFDLTTHKFTRSVNVGSNIISSISTDGKDMLYVSTDGNGVHFFSHSKKQIIRSLRHDSKDKNSIRSNSVYSLLVDKEGIVWIGFYQAGFDYSLYQSGLFRVYSFPPFFDSLDLPVRSFFIHGKEKLIGTRDGLYYINEQTKTVKSFVMPTLRSNLILAINFYKGEFYIGTYGGGLSVFNPSTLSVRQFTEYPSETFLKGHIFCFEIDAVGNLWMGTSSGVYCYNADKKEMKSYTSSNSQLPEGNVYEIFFDSTRKGWICTEAGLCIFDASSGAMKTNIFPEGFVHKEKIRTIYEDSQHNLYFLPDKGSLFTSNLSMSSFYRTPMNPSLHGNAYMSVVEDDMGWLWLGCDDGLLRVKENNKIYSSYNFSDGVPSPTFTNGTAYKDEKGILWFGNAKGLLYVNPKRSDEICRHPYKIVLTDVLVNGIPLDSIEKRELADDHCLSLKHNQNNLTFNFANLSYTDPITMVYEYQLEGVDEEWHLVTGQNEVNYYDLSPGNYTFKIRIPGSEESVASLKVEIALVYSIWFWLFTLMCILLLAGIFYYWRMKNRNRDSREPIEQSTEHLLLHPDKPNEEKYKANRLSDEECKNIYEKLTAYMNEQKPYINPDLKIADLAHAIDTSSYSLSYVFNQYLNQSYYDFTNEYRIAEFKKLVNDSQYSRYTLSALAELCGFSSRASFFRSFKKSTGITPNEYIRSIGASNE
ncbi:two-component regulator propeller domain-containing protein [Bacteroides ihuae]|uniref:two-component regulator propeller domain-containing protein n=1 Tax=Bacteroides ihuae TaxID=1852362 RepID=UPI0008DA7C07|nr:two-component regulator propeller domain-containing protein [Bacteroides ihuae]